jgi:hypothetical protein
MLSNNGREPDLVIDVVVGFDENYSFVDLANGAPEPLDLDLKVPCVLQFRLSDDLLSKGWGFQPTPISFENDWGQNFSSYYWTKYVLPGADEPTPYAQFKVVYECKRMGVYLYSLFMHDALGQAIDLDPLIENGTGV